MPTWRWQEVGGSELGNGLPCLGIFRIQKGEFEFFFNNPFITVDFGNENVPFQRRKREYNEKSPRRKRFKAPQVHEMAKSQQVFLEN